MSSSIFGSISKSIKHTCSLHLSISRLIEFTPVLFNEEEDAEIFLAANEGDPDSCFFARLAILS